MPNHITTVITGPPKALSSLLNDAGQVDFSFLIPEPPNIEREDCNGTHEEGVVCWYEWNTAHWGTKWNAYDSKVESGRVQFDTAWSHPQPVIDALAAKHPDATFEVQYADEDFGSNLGRYLICGPTREDYIVVDPNEFAARLKYGMSYADVMNG